MPARIGYMKPASGQSQKIPLKGSVSGGSAPTPQAQRMHAGSAHARSSAPKSAQKLRG